MNLKEALQKRFGNRRYRAYISLIAIMVLLAICARVLPLNDNEAGFIVNIISEIFGAVIVVAILEPYLKLD